MLIATFLKKRFFTFFLFAPLLGIFQLSTAQSNVLDEIACDSVVLSPVTSGSSYSWSTSASSPSITVYQSDTFWVDVTTAGGVERDSFAVWIAPAASTPLVGDTSVCEGEAFSLTAGFTTDDLIWFQDSVSQVSYLGTGNMLPVSVSDTSLFWAQGLNRAGTFHTGLDSVANTVSGRYYGVSNERGIVFDVFQPLVFRSVTVYANSTFSANMELRKGSRVYYAQTLNLVPGANVINMDFFLPPNTDYRLALFPTLGGNLYIDLPFVFPPGNSFIHLKAGFPLSNHYNFFYDWQISPVGCSSPPASMRVDVLPTPHFDLGNDTLLCGQSQFSLDAAFPSARYTWSTGDTTAMISVGATDSVWAEASIGQCVFRDSIFVELIEDPALLLATDTQFCGPGIYTLAGNTTADQILWFEDSSLRAIAYAVEDSLSIFVGDSTTFYREAVNLSMTRSVGYISPGNTGSGNYYNVSNNRGLIFQTDDFLVLHEVTVYANSSFTARIELLDSIGNLLRSLPHTFVAGANVVPLNFYLPPSGKYSLMLAGLSGPAQLYIDLPTIFPLNGDGIRITGGSPIASHYNFFYNLRVSRIGCRSGLTPFQVYILPSPEVDLGADSLVCGSGPLVLDAFFPGASYLWNTGDTSAQLTVMQSDTLSVEVTLGSCVGQDTLIAEISPIPAAPQLRDTSFCGPADVRIGVNQPGMATIAWFGDSLGTSQTLGVGDSIDLKVIESRKIFAQATSLRPEVQVGLDTIGQTTGGGYFFIVQDRGLRFDAHQDFILKSVVVYANSFFETSIQLLDANGRVLDEQLLRFQAGQTLVELDFYVAQGNNYSLNLANPGGANIFLDQPFGFPIGNEYLSIKSGYPSPTHYNYFYDWRILPIGCVSTREALDIRVALPLNLPDTLYICEDTVLSANIPAASYLWSTGDTLSSLPVDKSGRYTLTVSDGLGCIISDTVRLGKPRAIALGTDGILCGNTLDAGYTISEGTILWSTGDTTARINITSPNTYWVQVEEANGCVLSDTIAVTGFETIPTVDLGSDVSACDEATLDAGNIGNSYLWNTGDTTQFIKATQTGRYWVFVTNAAGCTGRDSLNVNITRRPSALFTSQIDMQDPTRVSFFNLSSLGGSPASILFEWLFGDGATANTINAVHSYQDSGTYTIQLIVTTNCGSDTFQQVVTIKTSVGIDSDLLSEQMDIYPNPASERLFIRFKEGISQAFSISLYDEHGRLFWQKELSHAQSGDVQFIDLDHQAAGIYYLRFSAGVSGAKTVLVIR